MPGLVGYTCEVLYLIEEWIGVGGGRGDSGRRGGRRNSDFYENKLKI